METSYVQMYVVMTSSTSRSIHHDVIIVNAALFLHSVMLAYACHEVASGYIYIVSGKKGATFILM